MDGKPEIDETWKHQKKSRKKKFHIERRCVSQERGFLHDMYTRQGWYDWHRYRSYETERAMLQALELLRTKKLPYDSEWEYRIENA